MRTLRPQGQKIRVLVVDDSALMRSVLARHLNDDPDIRVVGTARDGLEALEQTRDLTPDVVTMDIEMPRMDGLAALELLMRDMPTAVVMVSALSGEGSDATIRALELGAVDFVLKPTLHGVPAIQALASELSTKVKLAARATLQPRGAAVARKRAAARGAWQDKIVVIGSSTGGPRALCTLFACLPEDFYVPILVIQHMPAGFTCSLAQRLDQISPLSVKEAQRLDKIVPGQALVARGGYHMRIGEGRVVRLDDSAPECGVRPSINVTMESAVAAWGSSIVGVILTGMGVDGTRGAGLVRSAGGEVIAQDASTCVIYGMPRSVVESGYASVVAPIRRIAAEITWRCQSETMMRRVSA